MYGVACEINALDRVRACWPLSDSIDHTNRHSRITRDLSIHRVVRERARASECGSTSREERVVLYHQCALAREATSTRAARTIRIEQPNTLLVVSIVRELALGRIAIAIPLARSSTPIHPTPP